MKTASKKSKNQTSRRTKHDEGHLVRFLGAPSVSGNGGGKIPRLERPKRNPAKLTEESRETQKANELMLRAWERIYAKRDKFGKLA